MFKSLFQKKKKEETHYEIAGISMEKVSHLNIYLYDDIYHALKKHHFWAAKNNYC